MIFCRLRIVLTLRGPVLTQSTTAGSYGIDAAMARRPTGEFYLPFSLVKGRLRQSWDELQDCDIPSPGTADDWLGSKSIAGNLPNRSRMTFSDFVCASSGSSRGIRTRIEIDRTTGAVSHGMMQVIEAPFAAGDNVSFSGHVEFTAPGEAEAKKVEDWMRLVLFWTPCFGANTSIGFGQLVQAEVLPENVAEPAPLAISAGAADSKRFGLIIKPAAPFCLAKRRMNGNTFESSEIISGAALKGTIATTLRRLAGHQEEDVTHLAGAWALLGQHLAVIRISHAFPSASGERPVVLPWSLVKSGDAAWFDAALHKDPILLGKKAPAFRMDWKEEDDVKKAFGWPRLKRQVLVRTAIDRAQRRAKDNDLFAYEMIVPGDRTWYAEADFSAISDKAMCNEVMDRFQELCGKGLAGLGKTKVALNVLPTNDPALSKIISRPQAPLPGNLWVIALQTPALLCDPANLKHGDGGVSLFAEYRRVWKEKKLADGALELSHFFARQDLAGGYLCHRFQEGKRYEPFLLTDAGSVFVFEEKSAAARDKLQDWLVTGLPLPEWAVNRYGAGWQTCPFRPQEGFGEIAVNLACHTDNDAAKADGGMEVIR